jgi:hypothetical protein
VAPPEALVAAITGDTTALLAKARATILPTRQPATVSRLP